MQSTQTNKDYSKVATEEQIELTQTALIDNGFKVIVVDDLKQLHDEVIKLIPEKTQVFTATSKTIDEAGLTEELNSAKYQSVREMFMPLYGQPDKQVEMKRIGSASDWAIGSAHAVTKEGHILIASASGSQIPNYVYGASNFILAIGSQKLVDDLDEGLERIETHTFPLEDARAQVAYGAHSSINKILIYRKETQGRGTVIIVKQAVGF